MNAKLEEKCLNANFEAILKKKGYVYFDKGAFNLNLIGVRASGNKITNAFDDVLVVIYKDKNNNTIKRCFSFTTDPGLYYMKNNLSPKGCAIVKEGQYRGLWKVGLHQGKYRALVQNKPIKVYRDNNKDNYYDLLPNKIEEGVFGINLHKAGKDSIQVDKWSAGCQVISSSLEFDHFMELVDKQIKNEMGNTFTYTLLNESDL